MIHRYVKAWSCDSYAQLGVMLHHHPVTALTVSNIICIKCTCYVLVYFQVINFLCVSATCEGTVTFWNMNTFGKLFSCVLTDNPYVTSLSMYGAQCYAAGTLVHV